MPPKAKITKEMVLNTVLELTREAGFETVNARSIAGKLGCSTRPVFTCYENMAALKKDFLAFAYEYYQGYVAEYQHSENVTPGLVLPLSYIKFAEEEPHLFQLLFISDMELAMTEAKDFYEEIGNEERAGVFSEAIGVEPERGRVIFLDLFLYSHGIAVLTATKKMALNRHNAEQMLTGLLSALLGEGREGVSDENRAVSD